MYIIQWAKVGESGWPRVISRFDTPITFASEDAAKIHARRLFGSTPNAWRVVPSD